MGWCEHPKGEPWMVVVECWGRVGSRGVVGQVEAVEVGIHPAWAGDPVKAVEGGGARWAGGGGGRRRKGAGEEVVVVWPPVSEEGG